MTEPKYEVSDADVIGADPWLETRLDHPEDVAVSSDGLLYAGGEDGQLYRINPETGQVDEIGNTGGFVLGVELGPNGDLYACDFQRHGVFRLELGDGKPIGDPKPVVTGGDGDPPIHPNYIVFDQDNRMYVSDSGRREALSETPSDTDGCIYLVESDGNERILTDETCAFPNGIALSSDGKTLFVAETGTHDISAIHIENGEVTKLEQITDDCGMVDGLALDLEDQLYIASIGGNAIYRYDDGDIDLLLEDESGMVVNNPTNIAFGGPDMQTLNIANLGLWHITSIKIDAIGRMPTGRLER